MPRWEELTREDWKILTRICVSLIALGIAATIILTKWYPNDDVKWAFGIIGLILGYWFK